MLVVLLVFLPVFLIPPALAQKMVAARAGMVYSAEGELRIDGKQVRSMGSGRLPQIQDGQVVSSPRGHAEILLGPSAVLWTGTRAQVRFDNTQLDAAAVTVLEGSAIIELTRSLDTGSVSVRAGTLEIALTKQGVYRFESSGVMRIYDGESLIGTTRLQRGDEWSGVLRPFDRKDVDEFHYWSAYRSFQLDVDAGVYRRWSGPYGEREHAGFGVKFPEAAGAARVKYQAATQVGLIYFLDGDAVTGSQARASRLPLPLGRDNFLQTQAGKAELFLGVGVIARIPDNSRIRMLDANPRHPVIGLETGVAMIEVADSVEARPTFRVGDSETTLLKEGLYLLDAKSGVLRVFAGEASTVIGGVTMRSRESQQVNLRQPAPLARFDAKVRDALFRWSADRSLALYSTPAAFMTAWEPLVKQGWVKHKQFGERRDPRPPRGRPARPQGPTGRSK